MPYKLALIGGFIALLIALTKFIEAWLSSSDKKKLETKLEDIWYAIEYRDPLSILKAPLSLLDQIYDNILGTEVFSKKSFFRSSIISSIALVSILLVAGLFTGNHFSIEETPWTYADVFAKYGEEEILKNKLAAVNESFTEEDITSLKMYVSYVTSTTGKVINTSIFVLAVLSLSSAFNYISLSLSRLMLREVISSKNITISVIIFTVNLMISILLSTCVMLLVLFFYLPIPVNFVLLEASYILISAYPSWGLISIFALAVGTWNLGGLWVKIVGITTVLPAITLSVLSITYSLLFPSREKIHKLLSSSVLRTVSYENGIFAFVTICLTLLGSIIGLVAVLYQ